MVETLKEADLIGRGTETEAYMRVTTLRYLLLARTHEWDDEVIERLRGELDKPSFDEDTMVRRLRIGTAELAPAGLPPAARPAAPAARGQLPCAPRPRRCCRPR